MERNYISLFKAIGERDAGKMADTAKLLLETEQDITPARMQYVLAAGMLGHLAQGDRNQAAGLWSMHYPRLKTADKPLFMLQFLEAESVVR